MNTKPIHSAKPHSTIPLEDRIAAETESGREALRVYREVWMKMSGKERVEKAFRLTEEIRQVMRAGIRAQNPDASEDQIQALYVDRLLAAHGTSLKEIRRKQKEEQLR